MNTRVKSYRSPARFRMVAVIDKTREFYPLHRCKALPFWFASGNPVPSYAVHMQHEYMSIRLFFAGKKRGIVARYKNEFKA